MDDLTLLKLDLIFDQLSKLPENHIDTFNHAGVNFNLKTKFLNGDYLILCIPKDVNKFTIETCDCSYELHSVRLNDMPLVGYRSFPHIINEIKKYYGQ